MSGSMSEALAEALETTPEIAGAATSVAATVIEPTTAEPTTVETETKPATETIETVADSAVRFEPQTTDIFLASFCECYFHLRCWRVTAGLSESIFFFDVTQEKWESILEYWTSDQTILSVKSYADTIKDMQKLLKRVEQQGGIWTRNNPTVRSTSRYKPRSKGSRR